MFGFPFTPFIILPNLKNLPEELKEFAQRGDATFASTKSGWQTRETFLFWAVCFINQMSEYRMNLPEEIRNLDALLILDGHSSRENAYALKLLEQAHVQVLTLPAHTSHILQMFDVALASPLKRVLSDLFNEGMKKMERGNLAKISQTCHMQLQKLSSSGSSHRNISLQCGYFPFLTFRE